MIEPLVLQTILGVDKRNPHFTVYQDPSNPSQCYVYLGAVLLEVLPMDKQHPRFKIMVAHLYNAGLKRATLHQTFGVAVSTMRQWGQALASDDPERIIRILAGPGAPRKITPEIKAFIEIRFSEIYAQTHYNYSAKIRQEIKHVFQVELSSEALRVIFNELKRPLHSAIQEQCTPEKASNPVHACDCADDSYPSTPDNTPSFNTPQTTPDEPAPDNRKHALCFFTNSSTSFFHHLGVLLFAPWLASKEFMMLGPAAAIFRQWIVAVLLGAVNIERSKLLDSSAIKIMLGTYVRSLHFQRSQLDELANDENLNRLLRLNAKWVSADKEIDFYYDPHTKHYTGALKILKGWCPKARGVSKVLHMDFIHTSDGFPIFIQHADNFYDLRERFPKTVSRLRELLDKKNAIWTFIADRGIYKMELFQTAREAGNHIITWEKGYKKGAWDDTRQTGEFTMMATRNSSHDLRRYSFRYSDRPWAKDPTMRQIIVLATNPKGRTVEVSIIASDRERNAQAIIRLIFKRWIQENDFKYLDVHFGINEITGYSALSYEKLKQTIEDKQSKSGQAKALELNMKDIKQRLGKLLAQQKLSNKKNKNHELKIQELIEAFHEIENELKTVDREISRLQSMIDEKYCRLDTRRKLLMDAVKITARNLFYIAIQPFRKSYDNYRDDHAIFRNLTQASGFANFEKNQVSIQLIPTMLPPPQIRKVMEKLLEQTNKHEPILPDGSQRNIQFILHKREQITCD